MAQDHAIHLCAKADAAGFLKEIGLAREVSDPGSSFYIPLYAEGAIPESLGSFLSRFSSALVFSVTGNSSLLERLKRFIPHVRLISTIPPPAEKIHVAEFRWHQISGGEAFAEPFLPCPCELREKAAEFLFSRGWTAGRPLIVIHPGSGGARKCWGKERFQGLMQMLRAAIDPFIILLSGPADDRLRDWAEVAAGDDAALIHLSGAELPTVFSLLGSCDLYIGNDSGVSHLAGVAGCKVISIFGPTDPALWSPRGRAVKVIAPEAGCAPCAGSAFCNDRQCLAGISLERVLQEALTFQLK